MPERSIQPRRGHFKGVVLCQRPGGFEFLVFDVEEGAQVVADALTLSIPTASSNVSGRHDRADR